MPTVQEIHDAVCMTYGNAKVLTVPQIMLLMQSVKSSIEAGCLKTASAEYIKQIGSNVCQIWGKIIGEVEEMTAVSRTERLSALLSGRRTVTSEQEQTQQPEQQETHQPLDTWVQCDKCDAWHKTETLDDLPEEFFCENLGKACRAPKEAEKFWVASLAKRLARYYKAWDGQSYTGINHYTALEFLAARKGITIAELCNMSPYDYMGPSCNRHFRFPVRNTPTLRVLPMPYRR